MYNKRSIKNWEPEVRRKARQLRQNGESLSQIQKRTGVPKSTLHYWVSDLGPSPYQTPESTAARFKEVQRLGSLANKKKKEDQIAAIIQMCKIDVNCLETGDKLFLKGLLSMLYWAEGAKSENDLSVKFVNTDPKLALLFITLFRKCFEIDESRIRLRLHLHHYHKIGETKKFWSELLNVPLSQIGKIYIKKRSKTKRFRKNFMGICFIIYHDVKLQRYILNFGFELASKISNRVPVVQ